MDILHKIDRILACTNESTNLTWEEVQKLCPKSTGFATKTKLDLYRGSDDLSDKFGKATIRQDRKPRDSSANWHNVLNAGFKAAFGVPLRSMSLHCTGDKHRASRFGNLYKIYPSDDFAFYWSNTIGDLTGFDTSKNFTKNFEIATELIAGLENYDFLDGEIWDPDDVLVSFIRKNLRKEFEQYLQNYESDHMDEDEIKEMLDFIDGKPEGYDHYLHAADEFAKIVLKKYPNCVKDAIKANYKKGNSERDWIEAIKSGSEIMVTASLYCYEKV